MLYKLSEFEGPLDLLLHLISKHKLNIYDIKISELLEQYIAQIELMKQQNLDIASDFLEMAARLIYIKTALLLPKHEEGEELKKELTGQLLEYRECKKMAEVMAEKINLDFISRMPTNIQLDFSYKTNHNVFEMLKAYIDVVGKGNKKLPPSKEDFSYIISKTIVSVFSKVVSVLRILCKTGETEYKLLFQKVNNKPELVATFLAVLELINGKRILITDDDAKVRLLNGGERYWKSKKQNQQ
ncbi:MAG: Segregation and condensation protein A [Eubacteriales bacterium SKADARSKE-1]|nr:Segregation and condensation protein A [Eubacteriales bacterium SKADARSKE-1]